MKSLYIILFSFLVFPGAIPKCPARPEIGGRRVSVRDIVADHKRYAGSDVIVEGYLRLDKLSQRAFLHFSSEEVKKKDYKKTIYLEIVPEIYNTMREDTGDFVIVHGYVAEKLHGPLGVYPAQIFVATIRRK